MNNNQHNEKKRVIPIILIIIVIIVMLPVILSLIMAFLPVFLLGLFVFLIFLLIRLIRKSKKPAEAITPPEEQSHPNPFNQPENEINIIQKAFGLLQRRITEQLAVDYPGARWVWGVSNAIERFKNNEPLIVFLNSAGGYNKAQVIVHNTLFKGMKYFTLEMPVVLPVFANAPAENISFDDIDDTDDIDETDEPRNADVITISDNTPVNYERLAFEWVDVNMVEINAKYNEAIAQNKSDMLIPAEELPHPDSWPDLCTELKRNGFSVADFCENGIIVNITD